MNLTKLLHQHQPRFATILPEHLQRGKAIIWDLTANNKELTDLSTDALIAYTDQQLALHGADIAIGRYAEDRNIYQRSDLFIEGDNDIRSIHLGIDLTVPVTTPVSTPLAATVHSFQDNNELGDYGPTIILQHELQGITFYSLYGHLSRTSLQELSIGKLFKAGEVFGTVGDHHENGGWPPHLHFQIISDIGDHHGDFPGVASRAEKEKYLALCPDPNLILQLDTLGT